MCYIKVVNPELLSTSACEKKLIVKHNYKQTVISGFTNKRLTGYYRSAQVNVTVEDKAGNLIPKFSINVGTLSDEYIVCGLVCEGYSNKT